MSRVPISMEALAREYERQREAESKPKFLSKEERERIAAGRRAQEEARHRQTQLEEQRRREAFLAGKNASQQPMDVDVQSPSYLDPADLALIKERYLGAEGSKEKKRLRRFTDNRFNFDWDNDDDTSPAMVEPPAFVKRASGLRKLKEEDSMMSTHWSEKPLADLKERDWRILKEDYNISTQGGAVPPPLRFWNEAGFSRTLEEQLHRLNYKEPTPIQRQAIPLAMQRRDFIGIAETGSGKTLAFLLPMFQYIRRLPKFTEETALDGPYGLILAPTRELALQIEQEAKRFAKALSFSVLAIVGGHSMAEQSMILRRGVDIVIATPGRLKDCLEQHVLALNQCYSLVLDEADRMIDMNFEDDLGYILHCLPSAMEKADFQAAEDPAKLPSSRCRQTSMFSATMPPSVERLARIYLRRPAVVTVGQAGQAVDRITQKLVMISEHEKTSRIISVLEQHDSPAIVFVNQKTTVDALYSRLTTFGFRCVALHGGKGQEQREAAISQLKSGQRDVLIATDVASRGIDIKDVALVVNYDMAKSIEDYVHRIGRTGRAGKEGMAVTFLTDNDTELFYDLRILVQKSKNSEVPQEFTQHEAARQKPGTVQQKRRHEEKIFAFGV